MVKVQLSPLARARLVPAAYTPAVIVTPPPAPVEDEEPKPPLWRRVIGGAGAIGKTLWGMFGVGLIGLADQFDYVDILAKAKTYLSEGSRLGTVLIILAAVVIALKLASRFTGKESAPRGLDEGE